MIALIRTTRVVLILVLAVLVLSFVMGIGTASTGWLEKAVLVGLIGLCVFLAARVSGWSERLQRRVQRR